MIYSPSKVLFYPPKKLKGNAYSCVSEKERALENAPELRPQLGHELTV